MTGRKHDAKGRSTSQPASSRLRELNRPPKGESWTWFTLELLRSSAYRVMSEGALKILARVMIEHLAHGGTKNGELRVTFKDFEQFGVRHRSIPRYLVEAVALGFLARTSEGSRAWGEFKGRASEYRLEWLPSCSGAPPKNGWKRFATSEDAYRAVTDALAELENTRARRRHRSPGWTNKDEAA